MSKQKITWYDVVIEYLETFRYCGIFCEEPGGYIPLVNDPDGDMCYSLKEETPETVHDRIERSKKAGRNLFFEECPVHEVVYIPGCQY